MAEPLVTLPRLALTLWQPWATLVARFGKDVENRTWLPEMRLRAGDRFWIHAGKRVGADDYAWARLNVPGFADAFDEDASPLPTGVLLGHVRYDGSVTSSDSPWFFGPVGWRLSDFVALPTPILCRGAQGLWLVQPEALECAEEMLRG